MRRGEILPLRLAPRVHNKLFQWLTQLGSVVAWNSIQALTQKDGAFTSCQHLRKTTYKIYEVHQVKPGDWQMKVNVYVVWQSWILVLTCDLQEMACWTLSSRERTRYMPPPPPPPPSYPNLNFSLPKKLRARGKKSTFISVISVKIFVMGFIKTKYLYWK